MAKKELRSASVADKFIETATAETKAEKDEVAEAKKKTSILEEQANKAERRSRRKRGLSAATAAENGATEKI